MVRVPPTAALMGALLLAGCTQPSNGVATPPYPPVPAPLADPMPKPPVTPEALVWQPGHWDWQGTGYTWVAGEYVPRAGHGNDWQPGWWSLQSGGWHWVAAHWVDG